MSLTLPVTGLITSMEDENPFNMSPAKNSPTSRSNTNPMLRELVLNFVGSYTDLVYLEPYDTYNLRGGHSLKEAFDLALTWEPKASSNNVHAPKVEVSENFFFMSPFRSESASREYFQDCLSWVESHFAGRVLTAIMFLRENVSYCYILASFICKPLKDGTVFSLIKPSFHYEVLCKYGISGNSECNLV